MKIGKDRLGGMGLPVVYAPCFNFKHTFSKSIGIGFDTREEAESLKDELEEFLELK